VAAPIAKVAGAFIALAVATIPGMVFLGGLAVAPSETAWARIAPRDEPSMSGGYPVPPWRLVDWLFGAAIEITAFAVVVICLVIAVQGIAGARRRVAATGEWRRAIGASLWIWSFGVLAMSIFAAILHIKNWAEWHALLDSDVHIPYHYEPLQAPVGALVMVVIGAAPLVAVFLMRRRGIAISAQGLSLGGAKS